MTLFSDLEYWINRLRYFRVNRWNGNPIAKIKSTTAPYSIEILNDNKTQMEFVVRILQRCFNMERHEAVRLMLQIHESGSVLVGYASKEVAESIVAHVSSEADRYKFPLRCRISCAEQASALDRQS